MICQRDQCDPLFCTKKHDTEEGLDEVFWKDKRIQGIALVHRILVISLQFIACRNVPDDKISALVNSNASMEQKATDMTVAGGRPGPEERGSTQILYFLMNPRPSHEQRGKLEWRLGNLKF